MDLHCGIDCASGVCVVPDGTRNFFTLSFPGTAVPGSMRTCNLNYESTGGHRKKTQHARSRDRWHLWDRLSALRGRSGVEGRFLTVDKRPSWTRFGRLGGYFACSVSRSRVPDGEAVHRKPKRAPSKVDLAAEFALLLKRHGFKSRGLTAQAAFVPSLTGLEISLPFSFPALPCRVA
jgi:hypothetical protein